MLSNGQLTYPELNNICEYVIFTVAKFKIGTKSSGFRNIAYMKRKLPKSASFSKT